jgi:[CysO sulfur-carrier protein]-S-L-cysteine hydrolase
LTDIPTRFELKEAHWQLMLEHIRACLPEEACGLVGGKIVENAVQSKLILCIENELHSPVRFRMAPAAQLQALVALEEQNLDLSAIFHSHPTGPGDVSATDLAEFAYPGSLVLILSPRDETEQGATWQVRAFWVEGAQTKDVNAHEIPVIRVVE